MGVSASPRTLQKEGFNIVSRVSRQFITLNRDDREGKEKMGNHSGVSKGDNRMGKSSFTKYLLVLP